MRSPLVFFILLISSAGFSQQFGGNPPYLKWQQINIDAARVIFPAGMDTVAGEVAGIIESLNKLTQNSLGNKQRKVSVVLQNQTTVSNGYVGLGPFRSEFYLTPLPNSFRLGSIPWHKQLALHEYRHVQQYNNFNVGLSRVFRTIFGEEGQAVANGLVVPDWFFEGDAVFNETSVSEQGRGRLPYFFNGYRALWAADKKYSWMKLRNGSYRDYTPDHYQLGYLLVSYGYQKYGDEFWKKVTHDAASFKGLFYPLQKAIKEYSGKNYVRFRNDALDYFKQGTDSLQHRSLSGDSLKRLVTDEEYPAYINDSSVVLVKSSYKEIPAFVIRTAHSEKKLRVKDVSLDQHFSYRNNKIVYSAFLPDIRWGYKDFSVLKILDIRTGENRAVTSRSKYFTPDISEDGTTVVAVQVNPGAKAALHVLAAEDGKLQQAIPNPENLYYTYPKFYSSGQIISAVRSPEGKMSLSLINISDGRADHLLPFSYNVIGFPALLRDTVYFTASSEDTDRLFALDLKTRQLFRLIYPEGGIGSYQLAVSQGKLAFTTFTASGFKLHELRKSDILFQPVNKSSFIKTHDFSVSVINTQKDDLLSEAGEKRYTSKPYSKSFDLLNFHSLEPLFTDPDYRLSLVGENVLNTLQSEVYFNYNRNERFKQLGFNATYGAWFPHVSIGTSYILDRRGFTGNNQAVYWNEAELRGGLSVPLNLSKGRSLTSLRVGGDYVFKNVNYTGVFKHVPGYSFGYLNGYTSFTHQIQKARQHIYPRLAQSLLLNYYKAVSFLKANQFVASGSFYWPGLAVNHNFVINIAYHKRDTSGEYSFPNNFPFSRGYESPNLRNMFKWGVNYHLPLAYPDAGLGNIVYLQRVRANLFFDNTVGKVAYTNGLRINTDFRSTGTEIFFDTKWWNEFPVSFGIRYSYLLDDDLFGSEGVNRFEFILPVDLFRRN